MAPALGVLGFLILAGGIGYVWYQQQQFQPDAASQMQGLAQQVQALNQQVSRLQSQPAAKTPAELNRLDKQISALEQKQRPDLGPIRSRLSALEKRQSADLGPLDKRMKQLEQRCSLAAVAADPEQPPPAASRPTRR